MKGYDSDDGEEGTVSRCLKGRCNSTWGLIRWGASNG